MSDFFARLSMSSGFSVQELMHAYTGSAARIAAAVEVYGVNYDLDANVIEGLRGYGGDHVFPASAEALYISSSNAGDDTTITILGLDADGASQSADVVLVGQTKTAVTGTWLRVFSMSNTGASDLAGDVYLYVDDTLTAGVPNTPGNVRCYMEAEDGISEHAVYTIPTGYVGYMMRYSGTVETSGVSGELQVYVRARESGKAWREIGHVSFKTDGLSYIDADALLPPRLPAGTDIQMLAKANVNNISAHGRALIVLFEATN